MGWEMLEHENERLRGEDLLDDDDDDDDGECREDAIERSYAMRRGLREIWLGVVRNHRYLDGEERASAWDREGKRKRVSYEFAKKGLKVRNINIGPRQVSNRRRSLQIAMYKKEVGVFTTSCLHPVLLHPSGDRIVAILSSKSRFVSIQKSSTLTETSPISRSWCRKKALPMRSIHCLSCK